MHNPSKTVLAALLFMGLSSIANAATPKVVVTIKPLHSIVSAVMGDLGQPILLLKGAETPHSYSMKPSDAKAINQADLIVWIGENLETFLRKPLLSLSKETAVLTLIRNDRIYTMEARREDGHVHGDDGHDHGGTVDPHLWLDPRNMSELARAAGKVLGELDPDNAEIYAKNAQDLMFKTEKVRKKLEFGLYSERGRPFFVFHDAYQYLEQGFGLNIAGFLTVDPNRMPSAKRLHEVKKQITDKHVICIMGEPQFESKLLTTLAEDLDINVGQLDAIGHDLTPGPEMYIQLMERNLEALKKCLAWKK